MADDHIDGVVTADDRVVFTTKDLEVYYGEFRAVREVNLDIKQGEITSFIGPSGCGKSTVLRCFNRMNDLIPSARVNGEVLFRSVNLYDPQVNAVEVRRRVGMVFQKANPFPKSIYDNVAYGPRLTGVKKKGDLDAIVALLHDEVTLSMPPSPTWVSGRDAVARFFANRVTEAVRERRFRAAIVQANGRTSGGFYRQSDDGQFSFFALQVLEARDGRIRVIDHFMTSGSHAAFFAGGLERTRA